MRVHNIRSAGRIRAGRVSVFAGALLLAASGIIALAPSAFAHHPDVSGVVTCATDGHQVITWHIENIVSDGSDHVMVITSVAVSSGTVTPNLVGKSLHRRPDPPAVAEFATGTTVLPGNQTGTVSLTVHGDWSATGGPADEFTTASVTLGGTCLPTATVTNSCANGGVAMTFTNADNPGPVTFTIKKGATVVDTVTVASTKSVTKTYPMAEDEKATYTVSAPAMSDVVAAVVHDCEQPTTTTTGSTTTTTGSTTTMTAPTTTTTAPSTTTSTVASTTTSTVASTTTSTEAPTTTSTVEAVVVSVPETTTTSATVLGVQITRTPAQAPQPLVAPAPATLPRTGIPATALASLAGGLLLIGGGLILGVGERKGLGLA